MHDDEFYDRFSFKCLSGQWKNHDWVGLIRFAEHAFKISYGVDFVKCVFDRFRINVSKLFARNYEMVSPNSCKMKESVIRFEKVK